jgi:hypothetical protein
MRRETKIEVLNVINYNSQFFLTFEILINIFKEAIEYWLLSDRELSLDVNTR